MDTETVQTLMEAGYLATGNGKHSQAECIFTGLAAARPKSEMPWIGLAVTRMNEGRSSEAVAILRENSLKINSESCLARTFLGLALKLADRSSEAVNILEDVVNDCAEHESAAKMAKALLTEL